MSCAATDSGAIVADAAHPLPAFRKLTGMGTAALREVRHKGLPVRKIGLRSFILGRDWLEFVAKHGKLVESNVPEDSSDEG